MNQANYRGLSSDEVRARQEEGLINRTEDMNSRSVKQIILSHTVTYFNIMNLLLGILVLTSGSIRNILFLGVIICNAAIGIFQELRVKKLIDQLSVITSVKAHVIRNNQKTEIPIEEIVMDDVLSFENGDQICTDSLVLSGIGLEVNESMLTGESKPVKKKAGDHLFSGSFIVAGNAIAQVEHVGMDNYATKLVEKARTKRRASSEMQNAILKIIKAVSIVIIPIGILLFISQYRQSMTSDSFSSTYAMYSNAVVHTVSGVIGMIPEGLVLLTSVSFILGVGRLAQKRALVQEMEAIEALARTNILCTDKTGTITTGKLEVAESIDLRSNAGTSLASIMAQLAHAFSDTNATQDALIAYYEKPNRMWPVANLIPFSSERKYRAISFAGVGHFVLGAPEFLIKNNQQLLDVINTKSNEGYRVLLLGECDSLNTDTGLVGSVTPIGIIVISDQIRTDAKDTFRYFADNGVQVKVISGDNPVTVSSIAVKAGLEGGEHYIDATTLPSSGRELEKAVMKYNVFGRVKPEQKQDFVKAFQAQQMTVAMVGDGVNDVLAIKDADCGIAMAAGSDAAKQAAHIVLLDSDFSSMKNIVQEGRLIISNIERVSALYLTKTIYSTLLCLLFILLPLDYPFTPLQLGLISTTMIGIPSFLLTLERTGDPTSNGFLKHVLQVSLPGALSVVTTLLLVQVLSILFHWDASLISTFSLVSGGIISLLVVIRVCSPIDRSVYRHFVIIVSGLIFALVILFLHEFYQIASVFSWWSLLFIPMVLLMMMLLYWYSRLVNMFLEFRSARKKKK